VELSAERLERLSAETGFIPRYVEKVVRLLDLLEGIQRHPDLKGQFVLKGGTALNVFFLDLPRLSVDIDLNFVGETDVSRMKRVRAEIEDAMERVFQRSDLSIVSKPTDSHSASQWILNYNQATRGKDSIKVDLNYLRRVSILEPQNIEPSNIGSFEFKSFPVLDINELAAGKLKALFERNSSKDLYDVHKILNKTELEEEKLRVAFVVYGGSSRQDWRKISLEKLDSKYTNMKNTLFNMLRGNERNQLVQLRENLTDSVKKGLSVVLPFQDSEKEFLRKINLEGEIKPSLITEDSGLQNKIRKDPALRWKVKNVKEHYGLN